MMASLLARAAPDAGSLRTRLVTALRLLVGLGSLTYVVVVHDGRGAVARLHDVDVRWMVPALLLVYAALLLRSMKWHSILTVYGQRERLARLWTLYVQS